MNYHINTILIWDSFKKERACPVCEIQGKIEKQLVSRYLNEAVMEDTCRTEVNKHGFCKTHFIKLYAGENKLGLALQTHTRYINLNKLIAVTDNYKNAVNAAKNIDKELSDCLICRLIEFNMSHYYKTIAKLYCTDAKFRELFKFPSGFCLGHYAKLLISAESLHGAERKAFLQGITSMQKNYADKTENNIKLFTEKYNYTNTDRQDCPPDSLKNCINNICGEIIPD